jgi:hypothetical protein
VDWHGESYKVEARVGETLLDTAKRYWLPIPGKCDGGDGRVGDVNDFAEGFISYFDILKYFSPDLQVLPVNFVTCSSTVPTCTRSRSLFLNCAYSIILSFDSQHTTLFSSSMDETKNKSNLFAIFLSQLQNGPQILN